MRTSFDLSPSVLIIDADARLLESYTAVLDDESQVYTATTGEEGLACLQRESIGLVILELLLSTMDGLEVLRRIKTIDATVPVIVLTAVDAVRRAAEAFKLGAREYLVKPVDLTCMLEVVRAAMASLPWHGRSPVTPVAQWKRSSHAPLARSWGRAHLCSSSRRCSVALRIPMPLC
jgi:DNA-binding response OmpR family regulator